MDYRLIRSMKPVASHNYECNACLFLDNGALGDIFFEMSFAQKRAVVKHIRHNNGEIQKGDRYNYDVGIQDGERVTTKSIPAIDAICQEFDIYQ